MHRTLTLSLLKISPGLVWLFVAFPILANAIAAPGLTRVQAIAIVRSIVNRNARSCQISKTKSITTVAAGRNWRVTARIVMSASGRPVTETAVWTVRANGEAVPANQLTAEIGNGCP